MDIIRSIADRKIREAMEQGLFDDLPGKGKPLHIEELPGVPEELRMAYKLLRDAGVLPEEMAVRKGVSRLRELIDACTDPAEQASLRRQLRDEELRQNLLQDRSRRGGR
jgi:DnaJ homologue, subfamily C, member 28, conserved domain